MTGGLPEKILADLDSAATESQYETIIREKIAQLYLTCPNLGLEESKGAPSQVLKGGVENVSFQYFDMRKYIESSNDTELIVIGNTHLHEVLDIEKIGAQAESLLIGSLKNHISTMVQDINQSFRKFSFTLDYEYLTKLLEYNLRCFFSRVLLHSEPEVPFSLEGYPCANREVYNDPYIDVQNLNQAINPFRYLDKTTMKHFIKKAIRCIRMDFVKEDLKKFGKKSYQNEKVEQIIDSINSDLLKLNCQLNIGPPEFIDIITSKNLDGLVRYLKTIDGNLHRDPQDFEDLNFIYIRKSQLSAYLTKIKPHENFKFNSLVLGKSASKSNRVRPEYSQV